MPGSTSRRDQHEDPRDNTVDLPRIDVDGLTDHFRRAAPMLEPETGGLLEPLPEPDSGLAPRSRPVSESRRYLMPGADRPGELRHPYADPDQPSRRSLWPAVEANGTTSPPTKAAAANNEPASTAPDPASDPDDVAPARPTVAADRQAVAPEPKVAAPVLPDADAPVPSAAAPVRPDADAPVPSAAAPVRPEAAPQPAEPVKPVAMPVRRAAETGARDRSVLRPAGRAPAGSLGDLRSRLARLPDGHPSSPYEDDGHARPLPTRLKQLELGLPAPATHEVGASSVAKAEPLAADGPGSGALDTQAAAEPAAAVESEPAGRSGSDPRPPEWADPYAVSGTGQATDTSAASGPSADLTLGPWHSAPPRRVSGLEGLSARGANGHGPPNGHGSGSGRRGSQQRTDRPDPDRPDSATADVNRRSQDDLLRADSQETAQDTADHRILSIPTVDLGELVDRTLTAGRTAEGRNVLGGYGNSGLTPAMHRLAAHLPFGGLASESEGHSLKTSERLTAKITRLLARNPGRTADEVAATIGDVVRYAFTFEAADYVEGTWLVHRRLKSQGFELEIRRNRWESPEYKGIFTQWRDPAHHIAFEVQFHTTASWSVVQRTHDACVRITDPATPPAERARLRARQVAAAATANAPHGSAELADFRLEAR